MRNPIIAITFLTLIFLLAFFAATAEALWGDGSVQSTTVGGNGVYFSLQDDAASDKDGIAQWFVRDNTTGNNVVLFDVHAGCTKDKDGIPIVIKTKNVTLRTTDNGADDFTVTILDCETPKPAIENFTGPGGTTLKLQATPTPKPPTSPLTEVGLNFNTGNDTATSVGPISTCLEVPSGGSYPVDVYVQNVPGDTDPTTPDGMASGEYTLNSTSGNTDTARTATGGFIDQGAGIGSPGTAAVDDSPSSSVGNSTGSDTIFASNDASFGVSGSSGDGFFIRMTYAAPTVSTATIVPLTLTDVFLIDASFNEIPVDLINNATLIIAPDETTNCATLPTPPPTPSPTPCPPASCHPSVGGIIKLPDIAQGGAAVGASGSSGVSGGGIAAIVGGMAAALLAVGTGGWYVRRRWLRRE